MNVLVIEDEPHAAKRLIRMGKELAPDAFFHGPLESIVDAVAWLNDNPNPDLILVDIHLADGLSFEIFNQVEINVPIIFTTAFDQYALRAFKYYTIDYLLKPIEKEALAKALEKHRDSGLYNMPSKMGQAWPEQLKSEVQNRHKKRFLLKVGEKFKTIETADVSFAYSANKATYLVTQDGRTHLTDFALDQLEELLDPDAFFRLNRQYISRFPTVQKIVSHGNGRLRVELLHCNDKEIVLSRDRSRAFKEWMDC
jgi:DNA-binding LytR/AlgR family response regulator